ncbi:protein FAM32A-like [Trichogramma pretiosum]|uniref:Protein FAM32A n=1 Tax=Trichogramma kaykai TaxID=54128 RepID=A0ABD2XNC7_9HYME|nr:protein FAM32A-like [Trichogramma pretiosum]
MDNADDPYAHVAKGPLKLKGVESSGKKKKKKHKKEKQLVEVAKVIEEEVPQTTQVKKTKAEMAFQAMKEKTQAERIKNKAAKPHKQRVEEFNRHLDSLTEHFDIPKVSWTK